MMANDTRRFWANGRALLLLALAVALNGCSLFHRDKFISPYEYQPGMAVAEIQKVWAERSPELAALKTQGEWTARIRFVPGRLVVLANVLWRAPDQCRVRLRQPGVAALLADVLIVEDRIAVSLPQERVFATGRINELDPDGALARIDFRALPLLLAAEATAATADPVKVKEGRRTYILEFDEFAGLKAELVARRTDLLIRELELERDDQPLYEVEYQEYTMVEERPVPKSLTLRGQGARVDVELQDFLINPPLRPEVFRLGPKPGDTLIPIGDLRLVRRK